MTGGLHRTTLQPIKINKWNGDSGSLCIINNDPHTGSRAGVIALGSDCSNGGPNRTLVMNKEENKTRYYFDLAFELAYWIHVNKEVAFFVAEDALDELSLMVENQEKNRAPSERLRGFWKGGERARPLRQTIRINEP